MLFRSKRIHTELLALLHHDFCRHFRVNCTIVVVRARFCESEREPVIRIERLGLEELAARGDRMRIVVVVGPRHGRARLHSDALWKEGVLVDLHLCVRRRRSLTGKGTGGEGGGRKRDRNRPASLAMAA